MKADRGRASWFPFFILATLMLLLCLKGGQFGFIGETPLRIPLPGGEKTVLIPSGGFILLFGLTWLTGLALLLAIPADLSDARRKGLILCLALLCRLALLPHPPSDDLSRYLWEGRLVREQINPYRYAPDDPALSRLAGEDPFHGDVNHPDIPAAYPPFILLLFSLVTRLGYTPMTMKLLAIAADMGTLWCLLRLLENRALPLSTALLYALNPVVLYSFAGQGHFDAIQNFFLLGAICFYDRKQWARMFLFAGLAIQSKYVAILTLPFLVRRDNLRYAWVALLAIGLPFLPFVTDGDPGQVFHGLTKFGTEYAFNGPVHGLLRGLTGGIGPATSVCKRLLAAALLFGWICFHPRQARFFNDPVSGCFFALGALLMFSPTVHFWYLSWVIPFLALRPFASWMLLCLSISGYFVANGILHHTGQWRLPVGWQIAEWLPVCGLWIRDIRIFFYQMRVPVPARPPASLSVIVPVRNEAGQIRDCIGAIRQNTAVCEIIVVDGGSTDATIATAGNAGARVLRHTAPPESGGGRGGQIRAGLMAARGDVVVIIHADTHVPPAALSRMLAVLGKQPMMAGGAIGGRFDGPGWKLRFLEFANSLRAVWLGISFGDQVQFFRRQPWVEQDLFPAIPLMEDIELSLRLRRMGRTVFLFGDATISARCWQTGVFRRTLLIISLFSGYLWKRMRGKTDTPEMYRRYYGKGRRQVSQNKRPAD
ncbi:glycosyltransferase [Desulfonema ishimotonii]|uniref:glycosyltransferase n=1 Tax=Desulfonema ishimotonii TaxID=45657 RepID=UPI000F57CB46|nr:glycosyltransferase [Desulfonema ishimotonii]